MAAPKGNLYALGRGGGRPRIYGSPEELELEIMAYYDDCLEKKTDPTITGLALYLGFNSRNMLYEYRDREEFSGIIKRAMLCVEMHYESALHTFKYGGAVFALKNMGWKDRTETDITTNGKSLGKEIDLTGLTDEELTLLERIKSRQDKSGDM